MDILQYSTCSLTDTTSPSFANIPSTLPHLQSFGLFSQLPPEIRLKIWTLTFQPRVVTLPRVSAHSITSSTTIPSIMHTNREARYEALRYYKLSFGTSTSSPSVYLNPSIDTVYIPRYRQMGYDDTLRDFKSYLNHPEELDDIKELALDYVDTKEKRPWEAYDKACLIRSFPHLRRISLVLMCARQRSAVKDVAYLDAIEYLRGTGTGRMEAENMVRRYEGEFRGAWSIEEGFAKDVAESQGHEFERWILPSLEVVGRRSVSDSAFMRVL